MSYSLDQIIEIVATWWAIQDNLDELNHVKNAKEGVLTGAISTLRFTQTFNKSLNAIQKDFLYSYYLQLKEFENISKKEVN